MELMSRPGLLRIDVATWVWRRDLAWLSRRLRPGSDVATWPGQGLGQFGVATWALGRDLGQAACIVLSTV